MTPDPTPDDPEPDDADLVAYLDGELDPADARQVEDRLTTDPAARAQAEAYKKTFDLLDYLPKPEPSPDFATRTVTRLQPAAPGYSGSASALVPRRPRPRWLEPAAWLAAAVAALAGGYVAHAGLRPAAPPKDADLALSDLRVIERLPFYLGVDDLEFARKLDDPELFALDPVAVPGTAAARPEPAGANREKLIGLFKSYPAVRQQQLRQLDQQFHDLPAADRDRLDRVLEGYAVWLDRLPDADRRRVLAAPTPDDRLDEVRRVREKQWQEDLTRRQAEQLRAVVDPQKRADLLEGWRRAERARRAEWVLARRQWHLLQRGENRLWPFSDPTLAAQTDDYIRTVLKVDWSKPEPVWNQPTPVRLTREEYHDLKARHEAATRDGYWGLYGLLLYRLARDHRGLPEPVGRPPVTDVNQPQFQEVLQKLRKKEKGPLLNMANRVRGRWPEFALEVEPILRRAGAPTDLLGPCRPGEFTETVNVFLADLSRTKLTWQERTELGALEGRWPEYPLRMMDLARKHDLPVPGVSLPGSPKRWAELYSLEGLKGTE